MYEAKIISGCWDEEEITLSMPKSFILSARTLMVLEKEEFDELLEACKNLLWHFDLKHETGHATIRTDELQQFAIQAIKTAESEV